MNACKEKKVELVCQQSWLQGGAWPLNKPSYYVNSPHLRGYLCLLPLYPLWSPSPPLGMNILGIFIGMIYGWLTVSMTRQPLR